MITEGEIGAMARELVAAYGREAAARRATDAALAELEAGHVGLATTWRRVLNAVHQMEPAAAGG